VSSAPDAGGCSRPRTLSGLVRAPPGKRNAGGEEARTADGQSGGAGKTRPAHGEARVERYTTYRLGGMRDPPSAQSGSDEQMFGAVGQVRRPNFGD